jgi:hypothetical protein
VGTASGRILGRGAVGGVPQVYGRVNSVIRPTVLAVWGGSQNTPPLAYAN